MYGLFSEAIVDGLFNPLALFPMKLLFKWAIELGLVNFDSAPDLLIN